jgi:CheY-like chemotaxis protein
MASRKAKTWLVVEDDDDNFFLLHRACSTALPKVPVIHWEKDGAGTQAYLMENPAALGLVISDIKMPLMDGFELLKCARAQPPFTELPFVIRSGSNQACDMKQAAQLGSVSGQTLRCHGAGAADAGIGRDELSAVAMIPYRQG